VLRVRGHFGFVLGTFLFAAVREHVVVVQVYFWVVLRLYAKLALQQGACLVVDFIRNILMQLPADKLIVVLCVLPLFRPLNFSWRDLFRRVHV